MDKTSKTPAILAGCGCLSFLFSIVLFATAYVVGGSAGSLLPGAKPEMARYANTAEGRSGMLAENYVDFSFDYPKAWLLKTEADGPNFVTVAREVDSRTWENLNVGYFQTTGSASGNEQLYPQLMEQLHAQFAQQNPTLRKVNEGATRVGSYDAYEGLFEATQQVDGEAVAIYTRVVLLPTPDAKKGVTLLMMGTSFHPELKSAADLGTKGELPLVLESFRFD